RFSSEDEQNVLEEQQARNSGLTENRSASPSSPSTGLNRPSTNRKKLDFNPESALERLAEKGRQLEGDIAVGEQKQDDDTGASNEGKALDFSRFGSIERGVSTVGEALPTDIKFGDFTALNTDRHLYYTFYARIEEMIRGRWVNYIKATLYGMETGTVRIPTRTDWTTRLEIVLDRNGIFRKAILHDSSGSRNLDSAPVQAFRDAHQFPNPPLEMVKEDGAIHLMYAFTVNIVPRYASGQGE
ncbi:MAG TPA: energy transducer TonB, partial [Bdellovibrionales bacterium]|nr:energy transducer TonB [Bdellovibrionales bacterium]